MDKTVEMEMKLTIARKDMKKLLASELITATMIKGSLAKQELLTTYYDTASYKLTESGMAYRIRRNGKKYEATVKTEQASGGGLSARREFNMPLKKDSPAVSGFTELGLETDLEELLAGEELQKLFTVEVKREIRLLQVTPETVLEMAIDQGKISAGKQKEKIDEVELEIKAGTKADLLDFTAQIAAKIPIFIEPRSKFARGLHLLGNGEEHEIPKGRLKIDRGGMVQDELSKLMEYYGDRILKLQNRLLTDKNVLVQADKLLLPQFKHLQALLALIKPLLAEGEYDKIRKLLAEPAGTLDVLFRYKRLLMQWQLLHGTAGSTILQRPQLAEKLTEEIENILAEVAKQLEQGVYSHCIFKLLAWTEQSLWQNSYYVEVEQLAGCRVEDWYNMLKELDIKGEKIDEAQAKNILRVCEAIYYARRSLKIDRLSKTAWKDIKELYQRIQVLVYDVYSSKCLLNCIKGNNSRALYRDSGLLIGWRLQSMQSANTKALKAYGKVVEALKK